MMKEKRFFRLPICELQHLRVLLGTSPTRWLAQSLDVRSSGIRVPSVVLHTSQEQFLEVSSDWAETVDRVNYHVMVVTLTSSPNTLSSSIKNGVQLLDSCSSVEFANHSSISEVQVYSYTDALLSDAKGESCVTYDSVLVCRQASGNGFAIACTDSILGGVTFVDNAKAIEQLLEDRELRWSTEFFEQQ